MEGRSLGNSFGEAPAPRRNIALRKAQSAGEQLSNDTGCVNLHTPMQSQHLLLRNFL